MSHTRTSVKSRRRKATEDSSPYLNRKILTPFKQNPRTDDGGQLNPRLILLKSNNAILTDAVCRHNRTVNFSLPRR
jgi:hypothetical protein